ncbi:AAA family ATPase [Kitasatospora sp. GP82]|uniref:AAA family ATPase n=1 Tax=Kitasatospora sp. GP82 TaxID=3035089 RepID=UPI002476BE17|nr:AAA family ATPase [Kitasatospora sp. GP82]MDH6123154.1 energy-coupling factor transporter ATP-binding protein EcfA2 [Kitasatospora sp. GP82]
MYVARLRIENLGGFRGERTVDLDLTRPDGSHAGWTVLAGPNGSGKTALLHALAHALGRGPADPAWLHGGGGAGEVRVIGAAAEEVRWQLARTDGGLAEHRSGTHAAAVAPVATRFHGSATLAESIRWLMRHQSDSVFAMLDDGLLPEGHRIARVDSGGLWIAQGGSVLPADALGGGVRAAIALVLDLLRHAQPEEPGEELVVDGELPTAPAPGLALVDEAEAHLHLARQQQLGEWLVAHFPKVQFLVSTHSPYICQAADPGGLIRLPGPTEQVPPRILDEDLHQRIVYGSGDDAALTELFGLPSVHSPQAEAERQLLIALERKLYAGRASTAEAAEYRALGARLNSSLTARVDEVRSRRGGRP